MILQTTVKEIGEALGSKRTYVQLISEANGEPQADHEAKYNEPSL